MKKLRWLPHVITTIPVLVFAEFPEPQKDPLKIKIWGQVAYLPEIDRYGVTYMSAVDRVQRYTDEPFLSVGEAMTAVEQQLFEEGIREDA